MNKYSDIIVVVHGIGDQFRNATVRSVANRLATSRLLTGGLTGLVTAPEPLGYFYNDPSGPVVGRPVDPDGRLGTAPLTRIGVAEVYWADIPQALVTDAHTLDETKEWAGTVVARAKALFDEAQTAHADLQKAGQASPAGSITELVKPDFSQAADTLDEMIDTIKVLENIFALAEKAGVFSFDLKEVLDMYLGDVQVVAEFEDHRTNVVGRFSSAMENVYAAAENPDVRLHIVAHSEGTVVSFLGLLRAMSQQQFVPANPSGTPPTKTGFVATPGTHPAWLKHVAGYMTLGSPIDKHLLLWRRMWRGLDPALANNLFAGRPIVWHNYYDYGDPVGFKLDTARDWIAGQGLTAFDFPATHDHGFARYMLPGAAHNEYWNDPEVFEHFFSNVIVAPPQPKPAPKSRPEVVLFSPLIPYVLSFVILCLGTYLLYKQVADFSHPKSEPLEAADLVRYVGITPSAPLDGGKFFLNVLGVTLLTAGTTFISRVPRIMIQGFKRLLVMAVGFVASGAAYWILVQEESRNEIGAIFTMIHRCGGGPLFEQDTPTICVLIVALLVALFGLGSVMGGGSRRTRWFWRGMRPMIAVGALGVALIIIGRVSWKGAPLNPKENAFLDQQFGSQAEAIKRDIASARLERDELDQFFANFQLSDVKDHVRHLPQALPLLANRPPLWPVVLAAAAFLYLWWLATLIFDLAFIWQRYVRNSVSNDRMHSWYRTKNAAKPNSSGSGSGGGVGAGSST